MKRYDIKNILGCDPFVFPRDAFIALLGDKRPPAQYVCVFNTHVSSGPGEQWIAFTKDGERGWYFDSYGQHPERYPDVARIDRRFKRGYVEQPSVARTYDDRLRKLLHADGAVVKRI